MEGAGDTEDRTEAATPRRLQKAREEGSVALSREAPLLAGTAVAALALGLTLPGAVRHLFGELTLYLAQPDRIAPGEGLRAAALAIAWTAGPVVVLVAVAAVGVVLAQTGFLVTPAAALPDLARLSPGRGLARLLGADTLAEAGKSLLKLVAAVIVVWQVLGGSRQDLLAASFTGPAWLAGAIARDVLRVLLALLAVQAVVAGADILRVRLAHARRLRMSREDIRQEMRESEGDPWVKGRLRQLRLQGGRRRMLAAVAEATVVVTNPTHYAIALVYQRGGTAAPRVVAKGMDVMAARIRDKAREHNVPLVANPPLARALWRTELDAEIPAEHYRAVAEIIAWIWKLRGRL
jgi:flagellar biosynthesis protein FlhB